MEEGIELNKIAEETISSYEVKAEIVISLIKQVVQKIKAFHREQIKMTDRLKDMLAKNQSLRRKDFDTMISDIRFQQAQREKEITQMVHQFCTDEEMIITTLRDILWEKGSCPLEEFNILKKTMLNRPVERELSRMLKNFHQEQEELAAAIKKLLVKGDSVKIKDLKAMIKAFKIEHQPEISRVDEMLDEFEKIRTEINTQWKRVMTTTAQGKLSSPLAES